MSGRKAFEDTYHPAHMVAGICNSPTLSQVEDLLEHGANATKKAKAVTDFAGSIDALGTAGEKLSVAAEKLNVLTQKSKSVVGDASAACEIGEAISVLNEWALPNSKVSNLEAAKAFDKLFGGAANFFEKLPPPVNSYAKILQEICRVSFFQNMQKLGEPTARPRERRLFEEIDKGMGGAF